MNENQERNIEKEEVLPPIESTNNLESNQNWNKKLKILIIVLLLIAIVGVLVYFLYFKNKESKKNAGSTPETKETSLYRMTGNGLQNFDLKFLQLESASKNIIYSPLSLKYSLAMLSEGSAGTTKTQIDNIIGDYLPTKYINSSNVSFANAMFVKDSYTNSVNNNYINNLKIKFNAAVIYDKFENAQNINSWVNKNTLGLIDELVDDINDNYYYLVNTLAIDMNWKHVIQAISNACDVTGETLGEYGRCQSNMDYDVAYYHENYQDSICEIGMNGCDYSSLRFNGLEDRLAVNFATSINNYDIVTTLGKENIRKMIKQEYLEFIQDGGCGDSDDAKKEEDIANADSYVENFLKELDSNYKNIDISTDYKFYVDDNIKMFAKDLKEYSNIALEYIAIMPIKDDLNSYIKNITAESLNANIDKLKEIKLENFEKGYITKIKGTLPLFKYDYKINLINDLKSLGITDIFDGTKADLSPLTKVENTYIKDAVHKATIDFSNYGIKASSITEAGASGDADCAFEHLYEVPIKEIDLTFNKPFMYIIRDKNTKEAWFAGVVYEPLQNEHNLVDAD